MDGNVEEQEPIELDEVETIVINGKKPINTNSKILNPVFDWVDPFGQRLIYTQEYHDGRQYVVASTLDENGNLHHYADDLSGGKRNWNTVHPDFKYNGINAKLKAKLDANKNFAIALEETCSACTIIEVVGTIEGGAVVVVAGAMTGAGVMVLKVLAVADTTETVVDGLRCSAGSADGCVNAAVSTAAGVSPRVAKLIGRNVDETQTAARQISRVPGRVQSRINVSNEGWDHVLTRHFSDKNASQFTVPPSELRQLLRSDQVVGTRVTGTLESTDGMRYIREVNFGKKVIGLDKFSGFSPTSTMTVMTDRYGNLVTAFPGVSQ